jgi:glycosyltransferase involved in cell wall biosynthesis
MSLFRSVASPNDAERIKGQDFQELQPMTNRPWLSVLIPTYNGEAFLSSALDSIVLQADHDIECIVVDDGSTDRTLSILNEYKKRLPLTIKQPNRTGNWVKNTNFALSIARGKYACFLHQDDTWLGNRLSTLRNLAQRYPEIVLFLNSSYFIDPEGNKLGLWRCPLPAVPRMIERNLILERLLVQNFIPIPAPIFKRENALGVGGMDENAWYTADWDFWLKLAALGPVAYHSPPLAAFRIHPQSQTVVRSSYREDFRKQHEEVAVRHLSKWNVSDVERIRVRRMSFFSIAVNTTLASAIHGEKAPMCELLTSFLMLGPVDGYRYLKYSRIWERASARVRARLAKVGR